MKHNSYDWTRTEHYRYANAVFLKNSVEFSLFDIACDTDRLCYITLQLHKIFFRIKLHSKMTEICALVY